MSLKRIATLEMVRASESACSSMRPTGSMGGYLRRRFAETNTNIPRAIPAKMDSHGKPGIGVTVLTVLSVVVDVRLPIDTSVEVAVVVVDAFAGGVTAVVLFDCSG